MLARQSADRPANKHHSMKRTLLGFGLVLLGAALVSLAMGDALPFGLSIPQFVDGSTGAYTLAGTATFIVGIGSLVAGMMLIM